MPCLLALCPGYLQTSLQHKLYQEKLVTVDRAFRNGMSYDVGKLFLIILYELWYLVTHCLLVHVRGWLWIWQPDFWQTRFLSSSVNMEENYQPEAGPSLSPCYPSASCAFLYRRLLRGLDTVSYFYQSLFILYVVCYCKKKNLFIYIKGGNVGGWSDVTMYTNAKY